MSQTTDYSSGLCRFQCLGSLWPHPQTPDRTRRKGNGRDIFDDKNVSRGLRGPVPELPTFSSEPKSSDLSKQNVDCTDGQQPMLARPQNVLDLEGETHEDMRITEESSARYLINKKM